MIKNLILILFIRLGEQCYCFLKRHKRFFIILVFYIAFGAFIFRHLILDPGIWNYGDTQFPANEQALNIRLTFISHTWWDRAYLGYELTGIGIPQISQFALLNILYSLTRNLSITQFLWWVLIFAISGISMYWLTYYLFKKGLIAFAASLFYALSPWIVSWMICQTRPSQAYAFIPLLFLSYVLLLHKRKFKYAVYFALTSFFVLIYLQFVYIVSVLLLLYLLYRLVTQREWAERKSYLFSSLKAAGVAVAFLGFFSLPFFLTLIKGEGSLIIALQRLAGTKAGLYWGGRCTILNAFRVLGYQDSLFESLTLPMGAAVGWTLLSFLVPVLWILPLLSKSNREGFKDTGRFLYPLLLIGILLSTSAAIMSGKLFKYLGFIPLVSKDPTTFLPVVAFAGAPLLGIGVYLAVKKMGNYLAGGKTNITKRRQNLIAMVLLVPLICFISYPVVLWKDYRYEQMQYPKEYDQLAEFLDQPNEDFRVLLLPPLWGVKHKWAPYMVTNWAGYLIPKSSFGFSTLEGTPQTSWDFSTLVNSALLNSPSPYLAQILGLANPKYVILTNDLEGSASEYMKRYLNTLDHQENSYLEKRFGDIFVYKIDDEYFLPHIYASH